MPQRGELRSAEGQEAARLSAPVPPGRSAPPPFARTTPSPFLFRPLPPLPAVAWLRPACAAVRPTVTSPGPAPYHKYWRCRHRLSTLWLFPRLQCFHFFLPSLPFLILSRSSGLRRDEAESSSHPAFAFPLVPALFYFSFSAAAATAAQLVSVPRFSPHVVLAAYGPGRLGYFCSR